MENKSDQTINTAIISQTEEKTGNPLSQFFWSIFKRGEITTVDEYIAQQDRAKWTNLVSLCTALGLIMGATNGYYDGMQRGQDALSKLTVDRASKEAQRIYHNQVYGRVFVQGATGGFKMALFATVFGGSKLYLAHKRETKDIFNSVAAAGLAGLVLTLPLGLRTGLYGTGAAAGLGVVDGLLEQYVNKKSREDYQKDFEVLLIKQKIEKEKENQADRPAEKMDTELEMHTKFMQNSSHSSANK